VEHDTPAEITGNFVGLDVSAETVAVVQGAGLALAEPAEEGHHLGLGHALAGAGESDVHWLVSPILLGSIVLARLLLPLLAGALFVAGAWRLRR
jgi:hypothetical protein